MLQSELYAALKNLQRTLAKPDTTKYDAIEELTPLLNRLIWEEVEVD